MKRSRPALIAAGAVVLVALAAAPGHALGVAPDHAISFPPTVGLSVPSQFLQAGATESFTLSFGLGISGLTEDGYELDFGDGTPPQEAYAPVPATATHVYRSPGSYTAILQVITSDNAIINATATVVVVGAPPHAITFKPSITEQFGLFTKVLATGDVNGDKKNDVVGYDSNSQLVNVFLGRGTGAFSPAAGIASVPFPVVAAKIADVNKDGKADLVLEESDTVTDPSAYYVPMYFQTFLGDGKGGFTAATPPVPVAMPGQTSAQSAARGINPDSTDAFALADVNHDGRLDVIVAGSYSDSVTTYVQSGVVVLKGTAGGGWAELKSTPLAPTDSTNPYSENAVLYGDFNGDGIPDVVGIQEGMIHTWLLHSDGSATRGAGFVVDSDVYSDGLTLLGWGDFNGDGKQDLVGVYGSEFGVLNGDGKGGFTLGVTATVPNYSCCQNDVAQPGVDLNGDGRLDLPVPSVGIALGNGKGALTVDAGTQWDIDSGTQPFFADFNGDGKPDVLLPGGSSLPQGNYPLQLQK